MGFYMNIPLFSAIFSIAFTVIIGVLMIVAFVTGFDKGMHIIGAVVIGAVVIGAVISLPVALFVTKRLAQLTSGSNKAPKA